MNRAEIEQYLKEEKIEYRTDSSNMDEEYTRNKIRHRVMPYLTEEINPRTVEHMAAAAQSLEEVQDYLDEMTEMLMEKYVQKSGDSLLADNQLAHEPLLLQKCVLQKCLEQSAGTKRILPEYIWMKSAHCLPGRPENACTFPIVLSSQGHIGDWHFAELISGNSRGHSRYFSAAG